MGKQDTAGKQKHVPVMISQELEIIRMLEIGKNQTEVMASCNVGSSNIYDIKKWKGQSQSFMASSESFKNLFKGQTLKEPKLAKLDRMCKWLTATCSEEKSKTGPMVIEKAKCFMMK